MPIREESQTSVVIDTDQWSSGSLCTQQQETFTHACACRMLLTYTYIWYILNFFCRYVDNVPIIVDSRQEPHFYALLSVDLVIFFQKHKIIRLCDIKKSPLMPVLQQMQYGIYEGS